MEVKVFAEGVNAHDYAWDAFGQVQGGAQILSEAFAGEGAKVFQKAAVTLERIKRVVEMLREGNQTGKWPNSSDFMRELEVSRRTVARDLDFLLDEENAPIAYDSGRHG